MKIKKKTKSFSITFTKDGRPCQFDNVTAFTIFHENNRFGISSSKMWIRFADGHRKKFSARGIKGVRRGVIGSNV